MLILLRLVERLAGLYIAWYWRHQSKSEFLSANRTQRGEASMKASVLFSPYLTEDFRHRE
jgi:hypothetical protein